MKQSILLHNPSAGDEQYLKSDIIQQTEKEGFGCIYYSIKKDDSWAQQFDHADFAIVAGGDGTVKRVAKELVKRTIIDKRIPLAVLPMGTANNLAFALGIDSCKNYKHHIKKWKKSTIQPFDVGTLQNVSGTDFFLEGAGFGLFPILIQQMDNIIKKDPKKAEYKLNLAYETLHSLILDSPGENYWLKTDDEVLEGRCILLEVMNIPSIGPNLLLAPNASMNDGLLDVVLVEEDQREEFAAYIKKLIKGKTSSFPLKTFKTKAISIDYKGTYMHIDDELLLTLQGPITIEVRKNVLDFVVASKKSGNKKK